MGIAPAFRVNNRLGGAKEMKHDSKLLDFFEEKGFYIILFLCVAAIGISGYVLFFSPATDGDIDPLDGYVYHPVDMDGPDSASVMDPVNDVPVSLPQGGAVETVKPKKPEQSVQTPLPKKTEEPPEKPAEAPKTQQPLFVLPVKGEILKPFSEGELVFDETMGDWRTHKGTDYKAKAGDRVYAAADGEIKKIYSDGMYGNCAVLETADGLSILYTGLKEKMTVKEGGKVKAGDVIGGLGEPIPAEVSQEPHLHLEITREGERINPEEVLPEK